MKMLVISEHVIHGSIFMYKKYKKYLERHPNYCYATFKEIQDYEKENNLIDRFNIDNINDYELISKYIVFDVPEEMYAYFRLKNNLEGAL